MLQGKYPLLIALVLGLIAGVIAYSAITKLRADTIRGWDAQRILCASQDLAEGTALDEEMIDICETPSRLLTDSYISVPKEETKESFIPYGQKLIIPLKKGDPILLSEFEARAEFPLATSVPRFGRGVSIEVSEKSAANQLIRPNDHVDVVATMREPDGKEPIAVTLMEDMIVLATGRTTGQNVLTPEEDKRYTHVVLLAMAEEAQMLILAQEVGTVSLTLRSPNDPSRLREHSKTGVASLLGGETVAMSEDRLKRIQHQVEVCHGRDPCHLEPFDASAKPLFGPAIQR